MSCNPHAVGEPPPPGWPPPGTMDRRGAFFIYCGDPEIFLPSKSRGELPPGAASTRAVQGDLAQNSAAWVIQELRVAKVPFQLEADRLTKKCCRGTGAHPFRDHVGTFIWSVPDMLSDDVIYERDHDDVSEPLLYVIRQKYLAPKIPRPMDLIGDAKAASAIACITRSSHLAQNLKMRRLYASGSASFQSTA